MLTGIGRGPGLRGRRALEPLSASTGGYDWFVSLFVTIRFPSKRRFLVLVLSVAVLSVAVLCCLVFWLPSYEGVVTNRGFKDRPDQRDQDSTGSSPPVSLRISSVESALQFEWDGVGDPDGSEVELSRFLKIEWAVQEELAKQTASATLEIQDGQRIQRFTIEPQQLPSGSRTYFPTSNDIKFEITIEPDQGSEQVAIARFVSARRPDPDPRGSSGEEISGTDSVDQFPQPSSSEDQEETAVSTSTHESDRESPSSPLTTESKATEIPESTETAGTEAQGVLLMQKGPTVPPTDEDSRAKE